MSKEAEFFVYLLEYYAAYKGVLASTVLERWDACGLTELIYDLYDIYHVERLENAYADIDQLMAEKGCVLVP